jgi:VanZ family protein
MGKKPDSNMIGYRIALGMTFIVVTILAVIPADYSVAAGISDKINHLAAFYVLALLLDFSFPKSKFNFRKILPLLFYGILIEWIQYYLPFRECSLSDFIADIAGLLLYGASMPILRFIPVLRIRWETNQKND